VSRSTLALYQLDRAALKRLSAELEALLVANDAPGLAQLLGVELTTLEGRPRLVDHFLLPEGELHEALRRAARLRTLAPIFTSDNPALEGRLRAFDALREDATAAAAIDRLLNPKRVPWYLRRAGATCGWLDEPQRAELCKRLDRVRGALTPELRAFATGLAQVDGDVVAHDGL